MKELQGGICAVRGVRASGMKSGKMGLAIIEAEGNAAGVFTRNKVIAAPLIVTKERIERNARLSATIVNSGNANAFTGQQGIEDAKAMAKALSEQMGIPEDLIAVSSTGVIGRKLDVGWIRDNIEDAIDSLSSEPKGSSDAARAIMTTDTTQKEYAIELDCGVRIAGIAKGSGMIEPNMGTMLSFIYTDAEILPNVLDGCLRKAVDKSFNMIVVDGDTSTNDMALLTATGEVSLEMDMEEFQVGLDHVMIELAKMIARDGEGATKLVEAQVEGALTQADARLVAKAIVRSPLVKSAIFGKDPNWGRVVAAAGYAGADVDQERISLSFASGDYTVSLVNEGSIADTGPDQLEKLKDIMAEDTVVIITDLGLGNESATAWGCDLTYDYVRINAEYTT